MSVEEIPAQKVNIEELLAQGKTVQFHPIGTSMWPLFLSEKDSAIVAPILGEKTIKRGAVCLYRGTSGNLVLHRVYKREQDELYFVGDHQTQIEGPLPLTTVKGVMVAFVRKNHEHTVENIGYIILSSIWLFLRPCRWGIIHFASKLKSIFKL